MIGKKNIEWLKKINKSEESEEENKKNNESNQIVWMGFIKQKTTKNMHSSAV